VEVIVIWFSLLLVLVCAAPAGASGRQDVPTASGAVAAPVPDSTATDSTLSALVKELERRNPDLQAAKREIDVRAARVAPAGALPDPVFFASTMTGFTRPPFLPSTDTPNGFNQFGIAQSIPIRGTRALRTTIASADVEAGRWDYDDQRLALVAELKSTYLDYTLAVRSLEVVAENRGLLEQLRQIAETRFGVGRGLQQDVIKAQVEMSLLLERTTILEQQRAVAVARLNELLLRPFDAAGPAIDRGASDPLPASLAELQALVDAHNPGLHRQAQLVEKARQGVSLAKRLWAPEFMVGVSAQRYVGSMPWMYGVDVSVSLPVFATRKQQPMIVEASAALDEQEQVREGLRARATGEVSRAFLTATAADRLATLYSDSVLPQARLALESSLAAYQVGSLDFLSVLTNFEAVFAAQVSQLEQQTRRDQALARLEPYVGATFVH
jgi:outer membrane protein, heavy metal efflux system